MQQIIATAQETSTRIFRWCLWEVLEKCRDRVCDQCPLWQDCRGKARLADGYFPIDDAIAIKRRSSEKAWQSEMLCRKPAAHDLVFDEFDPNRHIRTLSFNPGLPLYRSIDFGFTNPLVCLFIQVDAVTETVFVIDEHVKSRMLITEHARLIRERYACQAAATYCDPAGRQTNEITGTSIFQEMQALGIPLISRSSRILEGINLIRSFLAPASGSPRLIISPRCQALIRAMQSLKYPRLSSGALGEIPEKDGVHDHPVDALRYFFINYFNYAGGVSNRAY